ncbi:MAG: hypothetical protein KY476_00140 [Planctomycetes bacterium]|nr:hypothetical protein [Planctomycetota bacterium]
MNDAASRHAEQMLHALAAANGRLIELAGELRRRSDVAEVSRRIDCRRYEQRTVVEGYVDAELVSGHAVSWWLEAGRRDDGWMIETAVLRTTAEGQETLIEFPVRSCETFAEFLDQLDTATLELTGSLSAIDLPEAVAVGRA